MKILGIETSCDETSVALLEVKRGKPEVIKEMTASQILTHAKYGGVVPEVAARKHIETLPGIVRKMKLDPKSIDGIAVTRGPGLITSLRVGTDFARGLAYGWNKPIVGVNHIEGHIAANFIGTQISDLRSQSSSTFPAVVLVVSGGHTELILMKGFGKYERLGATLDDAAGEAFDKVAKMLGLGYPGGPEISKRAEKGDPTAFDLPRPMLNKKNLDFSFSGLKTAVLYMIQREAPRRGSGKKAGLGKKGGSGEDGSSGKKGVSGKKGGSGKKFINDMCASFQEAAVEVLVKKTVRAVLKHRAKTVFLAGGVSANKRLRTELCSFVKDAAPDVTCVLPDLKYTTDNAAMIAMAGYFHLQRDASRLGSKKSLLEMEPDPNWELGM